MLSQKVGCSLFIEMQSSTQTVTALAKREGVSRKFLYQQQQKGNQALEKEFNQPKEESDIRYWIPVTKNWIFQVILGLIFICHSSNPRSCRISEGFIRLSNKRCYGSQPLCNRWCCQPQKSIPAKTYQELRWD